MQYFIYSKSGNRQIVKDDVYFELLKSGEFFKTPHDAKLAIEEELNEARKKQKDADEGRKQEKVLTENSAKTKKTDKE